MTKQHLALLSLAAVLLITLKQAQCSTPYPHDHNRRPQASTAIERAAHKVLPLRPSARASDALPDFTLPLFTLSQLENPDAASHQALANAVQNVGMFAVTGYDGYTGKAAPAAPAGQHRPFYGALEDLVRCAHGSGSRGSRIGSSNHDHRGGDSISEATHVVELDDGTLRTTIATSTNASVPAPLSQVVQAACPGFARSAGHLRRAVERVGRAYASLLDDLVYADKGAEPMPGGFRHAMRSAESLEHFHIFTRRPGDDTVVVTAPSRAAAGDHSYGQNTSTDASENDDPDNSTPLGASNGYNEYNEPPSMLAGHSDVGVFLVMTAAEYFRASSSPLSPSSTTSTGSSETSETTETAAASSSMPFITRLVPGEPGTPPSGLLLHLLPDGRWVRPRFPPGALLVMNGEASRLWMREGGLISPMVPAHEVPSLGLTPDVVRAWFGRMYFPPRNAVARGSVGSVIAGDGVSGVTFNDYRLQTYNAFRDGTPTAASMLGCSPSRRRLADAGSCGAGEVYCWMSCMSVPSDLTCPQSSIVCSKPDTGALWPQDFLNPANGEPTHCFDCTLQCPVVQPPPPPPQADLQGGLQGGLPVAPAPTPAPAFTRAPSSSSSFCNTRLGPTTMWMTGFQFTTGNHKAPCVVFLFPEWVLDSAVKFAFACIGTFLMGLMVGVLTWTRSQLRDLWAVDSLVNEQGGLLSLLSPSPRVRHAAWWPYVAHAVLLSIVALQVAFGYWLMLVAMTYQAELFICVCLGLAAGHYFNMHRVDSKVSSSGKSSMVAEEKIEPCC